MSTETPKLEAKPCPFCGSPAGKANHRVLPKQMPDGTLYERRSVQCSRIFKGCMCEGPIKGSEAEAIEAWNARATDAELSRATEERDAALRRVREIEVSALATLQSWDALRSAHDGGDESERRAFADSIAALEARLDAAEKVGASSRDIKPTNDQAEARRQ